MIFVPLIYMNQEPWENWQRRGSGLDCGCPWMVISCNVVERNVPNSSLMKLDGYMWRTAVGRLWPYTTPRKRRWGSLAMMWNLRGWRARVGQCCRLSVSRSMAALAEKWGLTISTYIDFESWSDCLQVKVLQCRCYFHESFNYLLPGIIPHWEYKAGLGDCWHRVVESLYSKCKSGFNTSHAYCVDWSPRNKLMNEIGGGFDDLKIRKRWRHLGKWGKRKWYKVILLSSEQDRGYSRMPL